MKIFNYFFIVLFSLLLISCSGDDDNPTEAQSPLNGKWEIEQSQIGGSTPYSLKVSLNLTFEGNNVSGSGTINYSRTESGSNLSVTIQDNSSGSYNDPNINVSVNNSSAGSSFTYNGNWNTKNETFNGTVTITTGNGEYTYEDVSLFKNNN